VISYHDSAVGLTTDDIMDGFFEGWPQPPSRITHVKLLQNSDLVVLAKDDATGKIVGYITAITDGVLSAYIPLLEVLPFYRRHGIGHQLVARMLERLSETYMIDLSCDPSLQGFYEQHQMQAAVAMIKRNYRRQSGASD
jgi:ribosomal protein S18 acetylase RimI-like enzyme